MTPDWIARRAELYREALAVDNAQREEIARLTAELDLVKAELGTEQEAHRNALESLHRALEHRDDLARQLAEAQKYFVDAEDEWKRRNRSVLDDVTAAQELAQLWRRNADEAERQRSQMGAQLVEAQQAREDLTNKLHSAEKHYIGLQQRILKLGTECDTLREEIARLNAQLAEPRKAFNAVLEVASARERERDALGTSLAAARELLRRAETELWGFRDSSSYPVLSALYAAIAAHLNPPEVPR